VEKGTSVVDDELLDLVSEVKEPLKLEAVVDPCSSSSSVDQDTCSLRIEVPQVEYRPNSLHRLLTFPSRRLSVPLVLVDRIG